MHTVQRRRRASWADGVALATLVVTAVVVAWPVLSGGYLSYVDNPVHLGEVHSLAFETRHGWSGMAYCGFPLGQLHSPLWYGGLAVAARVGIPFEPLYVLALLLGSLAPALAVYAVARRRLSAVGACILAYLLLVQRPAVVGLGSAMGGMWTFYLGVGFWIVLVDRLARPPGAWRDAVPIAVLVALVTLTHLFLVIPTALLALVHVIWRMRRPRDNARAIAMHAAAGVAGVTAAALYWVPHLYTSERLVVEGHTLSLPMVLARLLVPTRIIELLLGRFSMPAPLVLLEALPMWLLFAAGFVGAARIAKRSDDVPLYGLLVAVTLWLVLTFGPGFAGTFWSGPVTWRLLYVVRVGVALAAIPGLLLISRFTSAGSRVPVAVVAIAAVLAGAFWNRALRAEVASPASPEIAEVRELWDWLRANARPDWGRVYLQDTFVTPGVPATLLHSHVLARTAAETGVKQLGAGYTAVPYPTARWTAGEFGRIFAVPVRSRAEVTSLLDSVRLSNTTHIVTCDPALAARLVGTGMFEPRYRSRLFAVLELKRRGSSWVEVEGPDTVAPAVVDYAPGRIAIELRSNYAGKRLLVKESFHPFWRDAEGTAAVESTNRGLILITGLPPGARRIELRHEPPRWPLWLSLAAWVGIAIVAARARFSNRA